MTSHPRLINDKPVAIFCGNRQQFQDWKRDEWTMIKYGTRQLIYIEKIDDIRGREFSGLVKYGTWMQRDNVYNLLDEAKARVR